MTEPKVVLITGCSSGIGLATAVSLANDADQKYLVYATMRNLTKSKALEEQVGTVLNDNLFIRELDVTKQDTIEKVVEEIKMKYGRVDILMNNAGAAGNTLVDCASIQQIADVMDLNFLSCIRTIKQVLPIMKAKQSGRIVNISSVYGLFGAPHTEAYCASKAAVEAFSESLAIELRQHGIWVSTVSPGPVKTKVVSNFFQHVQTDDLDPKTRASHKAVCDLTAYLLTEKSLPVEETVDVIRHAMEDAKPHMRYRSARFFEYENLKWADEHGDEYVECAVKLLEKAQNS